MQLGLHYLSYPNAPDILQLNLTKINKFLNDHFVGIKIKLLGIIYNVLRFFSAFFH